MKSQILIFLFSTLLANVLACSTSSEESCENKCGRNEHMNYCPAFCSHDRTCKDLLEGPRECGPQPRNWKCKPRCECNDGYVRIDGKCVKQSACCKDPNSELVKCPNRCPGGTCDHPSFTPCRIGCQPWGCQCKKGYVKNKHGKCIHLSDCPKKSEYKCGRNEHMNYCPAFCSHDRTCKDLLEGPRECGPQPRNWKCKPRCECNDGYVRIDGKCVKQSACCKDPNSELVKCPNRCPGGTCDHPSFLPCRIGCPPWGCQCKKGYVKNKHGKCIHLSDCPCNDDDD